LLLLWLLLLWLLLCLLLDLCCAQQVWALVRVRPSAC
jgi:hypothetical protein